MPKFGNLPRSFELIVRKNRSDVKTSNHSVMNALHHKKMPLLLIFGIFVPCSIFFNTVGFTIRCFG